MLKTLIPAACIALAGCTSYTYPNSTNPYYDVPPPQPMTYSYAPTQTPMTPTSMRHPFIQTTPAPKPLTPAPRTIVPVYHGPVISSGPTLAKKTPLTNDELLPTKK